MYQREYFVIKYTLPNNRMDGWKMLLASNCSQVNIFIILFYIL